MKSTLTIALFLLLNGLAGVDCLAIPHVTRNMKATHQSKSVVINSSAVIGEVLTQDQGERVYQIKVDKTKLAATSYTKIFQSALDDAGEAGGGTVAITQPGVYPLKTSGVNPYFFGGQHRYCLSIHYDNLHLLIGPGVTLKLDNNQQIDGAPVDMIVIGQNRNITIDGGGRITGNTAGQTGWTQGYAQISNGLIISTYGLISDLTIRDLMLDDHFSNPVQVFGIGFRNARTQRVRLENLNIDNVGEGLEVQNADDVWFINCINNTTNARQVGDSFEISDVNRFHWKGLTARGGFGFDIFGSRNGVLEDWVAENCSPALEVHTFFPVTLTENVLISNGTINMPAGDVNTQPFAIGVTTDDVVMRNIKFSHINIRGAAYTWGFRIGRGLETSGPITLEDVTQDGGVMGVEIGFVKGLTIRNSSFTNLTQDGIWYVGLYQPGASAAKLANLVIENVDTTGAGRYGFFWDDQGTDSHNANAPEGMIANCRFGGSGFYSSPYSTTLRNMVIKNITPTTYTGHATGDRAVAGLEVWQPSAGAGVYPGLWTLPNPSKDQFVTVIFPVTTIVVDGAIDLQGTGNVQFAAGEALGLYWTGTIWKELWRRGGQPV